MASLAPTDLDSLGDDVPEDLRARIKAELEPGERLLWAGRAIQPRVGKGSGIRTAALWVAGSWSTALVGAAYGYGALGPPNPVVLPLVRVAAVICGLAGGCIALGLVFMITERIGARRSAMHLAYALTDRRAILWRPRPGTSAIEVYTCPARSIAGLHRVEFADGSGDVEFNGTEWPWESRGFHGIADVRRVEALARSILVDPEDRKRRRQDDGDITMLDD